MDRCRLWRCFLRVLINEGDCQVVEETDRDAKGCLKRQGNLAGWVCPMIDSMLDPMTTAG